MREQTANLCTTDACESLRARLNSSPVSAGDGMCNADNPGARCICREEFGYRVCAMSGGVDERAAHRFLAYEPLRITMAQMLGAFKTAEKTKAQASAYELAVKFFGMTGGEKERGLHELEALAAALSAPSHGVELSSSRAGRVYIAGPMTGYENYNFAAFNAEADRLRAQGLHVENPADHGVVDGADWADYLRYDIDRLVTCARIHLLPGWSKSKGARLEVHIAQALGMHVCYAEGAEAVSSAPSHGEQVREIARGHRDDCPTCNGRGEIGGFVSADSGYQSDPCPECNTPAPSAGSQEQGE